MFDRIPEDKKHPEIQMCLVRDIDSDMPVPIEGNLHIDGSTIASRLLSSHNEGWNELHLAAWEGNIEKVKIALAKGINPEEGNKNGWRPMHLAAQQCHEEVIKFLQALDKINTGNTMGWTPLHSACWAGNVNVIKLLLDYGADAKQGNSFGWTPAHAAAWNGKQNILHAATWNNKIDTVRWLVDVCKIEPWSGNIDEWNGLHISTWLDEKDIAEFLLTQGVYADVPSKTYNVPPMHLSVFKQYTEIFSCLVAKSPNSSVLLEIQSDPDVAQECKELIHLAGEGAI
jgi:ankyrin repeat protein